MKRARDVRRHNITLGDFVVAVTDAAIEVSKNERKAYRIADLALRNVLKLSLSAASRTDGDDHIARRLH